MGKSMLIIRREPNGFLQSEPHVSLQPWLGSTASLYQSHNSGHCADRTPVLTLKNILAAKSYLLVVLHVSDGWLF